MCRKLYEMKFNIHPVHKTWVQNPFGEWVVFHNFRMHNKRQINCHVFTKVLGDKDVPLFWCNLLRWWNGVKELSGKWKNSVVQPRLFLWLSPRHLCLFLAVKTTHRKIIFDIFKHLRKREGYIVQCKIWRLYKFCKP